MPSLQKITISPALTFDTLVAGEPGARPDMGDPFEGKLTSSKWALIEQCSPIPPCVTSLSSSNSAS